MAWSITGVYYHPVEGSRSRRQPWSDGGCRRWHLTSSRSIHPACFSCFPFSSGLTKFRRECNLSSGKKYKHTHLHTLQLQLGWNKWDTHMLLSVWSGSHPASISLVETKMFNISSRKWDKIQVQLDILCSYCNPLPYPAARYYSFNSAAEETVNISAQEFSWQQPAEERSANATKKSVISCVLIPSAFLSGSFPGSLSPIDISARGLPSSIHLGHTTIISHFRKIYTYKGNESQNYRSLPLASKIS